jgi:hypothetical protein
VQSSQGIHGSGYVRILRLLRRDAKGAGGAEELPVARGLTLEFLPLTLPRYLGRGSPQAGHDGPSAQIGPGRNSSYRLTQEAADAPRGTPAALANQLENERRLPAAGSRRPWARIAGVGG